MQVIDLNIDCKNEIIRDYSNKIKKYAGSWFNSSLTCNFSEIDSIIQLRFGDNKKKLQYKKCILSLLANVVDGNWVILSIRSLNKKHKTTKKRIFGETVLRNSIKLLENYKFINKMNGHTGFSTQIQASENFKKSEYYKEIQQNLSNSFLRDNGFIYDKKQSVIINNQFCNELILSENLYQLSGKVRLNNDVISDRKLKYTRIFTDYRNKKGGRLYSEFLQTKKEIRKKVTINGYYTSELDFKCLHPTLLYAKNGSELTEDAYSIPGYSNEYREIIKKTLNIILNVSKQRAYSILYSIYRNDSLVIGKKQFFKQLVKAIIQKHNLIAEYFFTNPSLDLQYIDSRIALEIISQCNNKNIPVIAVHDSFIVEKRHIEFLHNTMLNSFKRVLNVDFKPTITIN